MIDINKKMILHNMPDKCLIRGDERHSFFKKSVNISLFNVNILEKRQNIMKPCPKNHTYHIVRILVLRIWTHFVFLIIKISRLIPNTIFEIDATFYQITFYRKREGTTDISLNSIYISCRAIYCMR